VKGRDCIDIGEIAESLVAVGGMYFCKNADCTVTEFEVDSTNDDEGVSLLK
jgi:hypothetical protein